MKDNFKTVYFDNLFELYSLYTKVRDAVILVENFDRNRDMYIAPINQLRSALDHVFKAISCAKDDEPRSAYELKEAKEHLDRAGYDALELLAGSLGTGIIDKLSKYETATLSAVFPEYYKVIKPKLTAIKQTVAVIRSEKKGDAEKSFLAYFDQITEMVEMDKEVDRMIPSLEEYDNKRKDELRQQEKKSNIKQTIIAIVGALVGGVLVFIVTSLL